MTSADGSCSGTSTEKGSEVLNANESSEGNIETWAVDRVEGELAIVVQEDDEIVVQVGVVELGDYAVEGALLRVPLGPVGEPLWAEATRALEAEAERRVGAGKRIAELQERDPGGDVAL
jgi:hypothetical protein